MYSSFRFGWYGSKPRTGPVRTLPGRGAFGLAVAAGAALDVFFVVRDAGLAAVVFFLELRVRAGFFVDAVFLLDEALLVAFFLVTFFLESLRLADDFPALLTFFFLLEAFLAFFVDILATFLGVFFDAFFVAFFLLDGFFRLVVFLAVFFFVAVFRVLADVLLAGRLRDEAVLVFFETLFLAAAFFFGMRGISGSVENKSAIIHRRPAPGSFFLPDLAGGEDYGRWIDPAACHPAARCSATTVV